MLLQQLRYFYELTKHNSISAAATFLHTTQSNLSQSIINLENELDLVLFYRSNKGVRLTSAGHDLLKHTTEILKKINEINTINHEMQHHSLSLAADLFMINSQLLQRLNAIYDYRITVTVLELNKSEILANVANLDSELGLILLTPKTKKSFKKLAHSSDLEVTILHRDSWHVNFRQQHPLTKKTRIFSHDLLSYPIVFPPVLTKNTLELHDLSFENLSLFDFNQLIYLNSSHTIVSFLHYSDAFHLTPRYATKEFQNAGLNSQPLENCGDCLEIALVKKAAIPLSPEAELFIQLFKEQLIQ